MDPMDPQSPSPTKLNRGVHKVPSLNTQLETMKMNPYFSPRMMRKVMQSGESSRMRSPQHRTLSYGSADDPGRKSSDSGSSKVIDVAMGDDYASESSAAGSTFFQSLFNSVNVLLGVGVLSLPYMMRQSGWFLGVGVLCGLSLLTCYTGKLLGRTIAKVHKSGIKKAGFPELAELAFGSAGKTVVSSLFYTELITVSTMFLILMAQNLEKIYQDISPTTALSISLVVVLPTAFITRVEFLSYFSLVGICSALTLLIVLTTEGVRTVPQPPHFEGSFLHPVHTEETTGLDRWPLVFGLSMVGFAGHAVFPSLYDEMEDATEYPLVIDLTYLFVTAVYIAIAMMGYLMYGLHTQEMVTLNFEPGYLTLFATWLVVINPATKYALTLHPVVTSAENFMLPILTKTDDSTWKNFCFRLLIRASMCGLTLVIAVSLPSFARIVSFIGAACSFSVSGIFPLLFYVKLCWDDLTRAEVCCLCCLIFTCILCAVIGTIAVFVCKT